MSSKKRPSVDGVGNVRRRLTSYQPLNEKRQSVKNQDDLDRARRGSFTEEIEQGMSDIQEEKKPRPKLWKRLSPKLSFKKSIKIGGAILGIFALFFLFKFLMAIQNITERNLNGGALALQDNIDPTQLKGEGDGRVNVLVIGIGGKNHPGGQLADTIMIVSIDPINNTAAMLSIPRDFYLKVPNYYSMRINEVHSAGESNSKQKKEGGGPKLLADTLENVLGIPVHYYVRVDFDGFIQAVDTVGGIEIKTDQAIFDPFIENSYGSGKYGFSIKPGTHHLDGKRALQYGRSRKTSSDFARAERQQEVLVALKNKILSISTLTNPVKLSNLISAAGDHARTDLRIDEILKLIKIGEKIDSNTVDHFVFSNAGDNYLAGKNIGGASVLVPKAGLNNFTEIRKFVRSEFLVDGFIKKESAKITVLNGTAKPGLAKEVGEYLKDYGYNIVEVADAPTKDVKTTVIYDQSSGQKPFTMKLLEKRLKAILGNGTPAGVTSTSDIVIIVGSDAKIERN